MEFSRPQTHTANVFEKNKISAKVYQVTFVLQSPPATSFIAGQTMVLIIDEKVRRTMSIASSSRESDRLTMVHDVSPGGPGSLWTEALKIGDEVKITAPTGRFVLEESPRSKIFVATGTGVAPFRSMLLDMLGGPVAPLPPDGARIPHHLSISDNSKEEGFTPSGSFQRATPSQVFSAPIALYWGLRREEDIFWKEEFEAIVAAYPNFRFALTLSQSTDTWNGTRGRVTDAVFAQEQDLPSSDVYLCGNSMMIQEMIERLLAAGVPKAQIKRESFF